ncbi:MAG TPA: sulfatase [Candidatus Acidoferrales bacterium]|nr:sulfatase [Candidatus Acidoferrales bacterium]
MDGRRPGADSHAVAALFLAGSAAAVLVALANVAALVAAVDVACVRDLEVFFAILGPPGEPRTELTGRFFAWIVPTMLRWPFELQVFGSLLVFTALSIAATLVIFWCAALLLAPVVVGGVRLLRRNPRLTEWVPASAYLLTVFVGFSFPAILGVIHGVLRGDGSRLIAAAAVAATVLIWGALLWLLGQRGGIRFVRACLVAGLTVAGLTWSAAGITAALGYRRAQPAADRTRPNVLLVSIDSLRSDHLHSYGYARPTSPTIDRLASEGVLFRTVVSPTSWTLPAHLTLLTALPPEEHGVVADGMRMRKDALFLTEVLWRAGYTTAGFVSAPYLDAVYGFSQGFDHYDDYTIAQISHDASEHMITSPTLLRMVSEWLDHWNHDGRQRPFFIFLHMWDVHYDYTPPAPYDRMFDPGYKGTVTGENYALGNQVHLGMDPRDLQHVIALYDGEIRFTDLYLGYVLDRLKALGILDNTVVAVTADHGDEFFEHGRKGHKKALYDESILVPLVIRFPGKIPAGKVVDPQVRLLDVAPTILALAGVPKPPEFGSAVAAPRNAPRDLTAWIIDDPATLPSLTAFSDLVGDAPVPIAAVRTQAFKFIQERRDGGKEELYNLATDPGEHANLVGVDRYADTPLRQDLANWHDACLGHSYAEKVALSEAHKERLRALGYVQ